MQFDNSNIRYLFNGQRVIDQMMEECNQFLPMIEGQLREIRAGVLAPIFLLQYTDEQTGKRHVLRISYDPRLDLRVFNDTFWRRNGGGRIPDCNTSFGRLNEMFVHLCMPLDERLRVHGELPRVVNELIRQVPQLGKRLGFVMSFGLPNDWDAVRRGEYADELIRRSV